MSQQKETSIRAPLCKTKGGRFFRPISKATAAHNVVYLPQRRVPLVPSTAAARRPSATPAALPPTVAGLAFDQLKKSAGAKDMGSEKTRERDVDRLVEEQENAKRTIASFSQRFDETQKTLQQTTADLAKERLENARLWAKIKDDEKQIQFVRDKMLIVQTMHDELKREVDKAKAEMQNVEEIRSLLEERIAGQFQFAEELTGKCKDLAEELKEAGAVLTEARTVKRDLKQELDEKSQQLKDCQLSHQSEIQTLEKECSMRRLELETLRREKEKAVQRIAHLTAALKAETAARAEEHQKFSERETHVREAAEKKMSELGEELRIAFKKHSADESEIRRLVRLVETLNDQASQHKQELEASAEDVRLLTEQLEDLTAKLTLKSEDWVSASEALAETHKQLEEAVAEKTAFDERLSVLEALKDGADVERETAKAELREREAQTQAISKEFADFKDESEKRITALESDAETMLRQIGEKDALLEVARSTGLRKMQDFAEWTEKELALIREKKEKEIKQKTENLTVELLEVKEKLAESDRKLEETRQEKEDLCKSLQDAEDRRSELEKGQEDLKKKTKELKAAHQKRIQKEDKLVQENAQLLQRLKEEQEKMREVERDFEESHERELGEVCTKLKVEQDKNSDLVAELCAVRKQLENVETDRDACRRELIELEADLKKSAVDVEKNAQLMQQITEKQRQPVAAQRTEVVAVTARTATGGSEVNSKREREALESTNETAENGDVEELMAHRYQKVPRKPRRSGRIRRMLESARSVGSQTTTTEKSSFAATGLPPHYW